MTYGKLRLFYTHPPPTFPPILFSEGKIGSQVEMSPRDPMNLIGADFADITKKTDAT